MTPAALLFTLELTTISAPEPVAPPPDPVAVESTAPSTLPVAEPPAPEEGDDVPDPPVAPSSSTSVAPTAAPERPAAPAPTSVETSATAKPEPKVEPKEDKPKAKPEPEPSPWFVGGFADVAYAFNSNMPANHVNRGQYTAPRSGEVNLNLAVVYLRHDVTDAQPWSIEIAGQAGTAADALVAFEPEPGGDRSMFTGPNVWRHIGRANAGFRVRKTKTDFTGGLMPTPISLWSFWAKDNWQYSMPWHLNGVPYVLMGGRVSQPIGEKVDVQLWAVNGWGSYGDVNRSPSFMASLFVEPAAGAMINQNVYAGPEDTDVRFQAWRLLSDTWFILNRDRWGVAAAFDFGRERLTTQPGAPVALWAAGSVQARARVVDGKQADWDLVARPEAFWDRDGRIYGVPQTLLSATGTSDLRLHDHVLLRLEYRYDHSTASNGFFYRGARVQDDDRLAREQHTVFLALIAYFERRWGHNAD